MEPYWSPSPHFAPDVDKPGRIESFKYSWKSQACTFSLHSIQALCRGSRLARAGDQDKLDAIQDLALQAKLRLHERFSANGSAPEPPLLGRQALTIELSIGSTGVQRVYKVAGQPLRVNLPRDSLPSAQIAAIKAVAASILPAEKGDRLRLGLELYRLLFGPADGDGFARIAAEAWGQPSGAQANSVAVEIDLRCDTADDDPWPSNLPWNLTAFAGETLAEQCGWSFEVRPPGVSMRTAQPLSPEPPLLLLFDHRADKAGRHAGQLNQSLEQSYAFAPNATVCGDIKDLEQRVKDVPEPEVLYVYAPTEIDLEHLTAVLGDAVPLVVLNLIGEVPPIPPAELVRNRKLILCVHAAIESDQARAAGHRWMRTFLGGAGKTRVQGPAISAFESRVRLWSGCTGLETPIIHAKGALFRRPLIKLLLDRISARREVSDEVATALSLDRGVLGLIAAGTLDDHPGLLPRQVWHHYAYVREAASRDIIRRFEMEAGVLPRIDELLYRFADRLGSGTDDWHDALDREVGEIQPDERAILSLEWRIPNRPADTTAEDWRRDWLDAWFSIGTKTLTGYRKPGVLIVHCLLVEVQTSGEAGAWCRGARDLNRERRRGLTETERRFTHHYLAPLSEVPVDDIEHFLDVHYQLLDYHPTLDPFEVAQWVRDQTGGVFSKTVDLMERLHDTGFQEAEDALNSQ